MDGFGGESHRERLSLSWLPESSLSRQRNEQALKR